MAKFYLSDETLPAEHLQALGDGWREAGFPLRRLALTFFGSRMFFAPEFRGEFIKSPVQFYLGLVQDLSLDVAPVPRYVLAPLRQMGQVLFNPPNVRGWVGGRNWINSASLAARRTMVEIVFAPIREENLNAEETRALDAARAGGLGAFAVPDGRLLPLVALEPAGAARRLAGDFLAVARPPEYYNPIESYLAGARAAAEAERLRRVRRAAISVLQSAEYQLC
jgi:hypothetical protein